MNVPILFLTYQRFHTAERVFSAIQKAQPPRLYFASNAPKSSNNEEVAKVDRVRSLLDRVDWPCEVKTRFLEKHLPVKQSVSSSLDWFFEHEEQGIILEDDCLPHPDFFTFCENLLDKYATDERVFAITGNNFQKGVRRGDASYYFSRYNHVWGWASWRRAWQKSDMDMRFWPEWKNSPAWKEFWHDPIARKYWEIILGRMYRGKFTTWDYPWSASVWYHGGLTATPNVNLVSNIGFGQDATHTDDTGHPLANMTTNAIGEVCHPTVVEQDGVADRFCFDHVFGGRSFRFPYFVFHLPRLVAKFAYRRILRLFS